MSKSIFVALAKTSGAVSEPYVLMSYILKILLKIIMIRMRSKIHAEVSDHQHGFMENK